MTDMERPKRHLRVVPWPQTTPAPPRDETRKLFELRLRPRHTAEEVVDSATRDQRRSARLIGQERAKVISMQRITKREREAFGLDELGRPLKLDHWRPTNRSECRDMPRPCPYVGCPMHLYLDVQEKTGNIKINFPDKEPWELEWSCALDVADLGDHPLVVVGDLLNVTRERLRQIALAALWKLNLAPEVRRAFEKRLLAEGETSAGPSFDEDDEEAAVVEDGDEDDEA